MRIYIRIYTRIYIKDFHFQKVGCLPKEFIQIGSIDWLNSGVVFGTIFGKFNLELSREAPPPQ